MKIDAAMNMICTLMPKLIETISDFPKVYLVFASGTKSVNMMMWYSIVREISSFITSSLLRVLLSKVYVSMRYTTTNKVIT